MHSVLCILTSRVIMLDSLCPSPLTGLTMAAVCLARDRLRSYPLIQSGLYEVYLLPDKTLREGCRSSSGYHRVCGDAQSCRCHTVARLRVKNHVHRGIPELTQFARFTGLDNPIV